jgi:hypothetical protein
MKNSRNDAPVLPRGRVATWTREQLDKLSTAELRALRDNAEARKEGEVATLCSEILGARPGVRRARKPA